MIIELKTPEIRKQVGNTVFVKKVNLPFYGPTYVKDKIIEVVGKNVLFDELDWVHFGEISEIRTDKPD